MNPKSTTSFAYGLRAGAGAIALSAAFVLPAVAHAQDEPVAESAGEIVVTARSKGETLLEVPVAVTAFGGDQLAKSAASDLTKIAQMAPQLEIYAGGAGSGGSFLIRGIGTTADTAGVDMSVSLAMDGTQIARPRTAYAGMFDLQQVAVMKGPQALFFGRNATAGVVSIQSANPTADLSGYVRGGYEFKARERYVEAAISIPITETLGVRFAGRYAKLRGWVENKADGILDVGNGPINYDPNNAIGETIRLPGAAWRWGPGSENKGGRVTLKWEPSSAYTSIMKATFLGYNDVSGTSTAEPVCAGNPTVFGAWDGESECSLNGVVRQGQLPPEYAAGPLGDRKWFSGVPYSEMSAMLLTWQQTLNLDNFTIQSNTGYSKHKFGVRGNYSGMEQIDFHGGVNEDFRGFSQELRLVTEFDGPFNVTVGGYYEDIKNDHTSALYLFNGGRDSRNGSYQAAFNEGVEKGKVWSAFGQARFDVTPELELAAGVRYTKTKKSAVQGQPNFVNDSGAFGFLLPEGTVLRSNLSEDNWSPEATITYHPNSDSTLYLALKTGYKSGGIAMPSLVTLASTEENVIFRPEKAKGGEIGYKARMLNRKLTFEATAYFYEFKGLQLTQFDPPSSSYKVSNAADAEQYGLELSLAYAASPGFTIRASGAYNHLDYKSFKNGPCWTNQTVAQGCLDVDGNGTGDITDLSGRKLHRAPRFSGTIGADYETAVSGSLMVGLSADVRYTSSYFASESFGPASKQHDYALVNASIRVFPDDEKWELSLIGRNLGNQRVIGFYQDKTGGVIPGVNEGYAYGSRPREVAVQGTVRF